MGPVDFVNSPHTGPYDTCLYLCLANQCLPELRAGIAYDVMFVNPVACFHADKVDNKIGGWENACFVTFDRKMLSGGNSTQKDRPKNLTHRVNLIELTYI